MWTALHFSLSTLKIVALNNSYSMHGKMKQGTPGVLEKLFDASTISSSDIMNTTRFALVVMTFSTCIV